MTKVKLISFASASRLTAVWATGCLLASCGGGGGSGGGGGDVTISGTAEYESVPNDPGSGGLNYGAATFRPIRQATVQLIDGAGAVLGSTVTSDGGTYSVTMANPNAAVRVRVRAESVRSGASGAAWDVRVLDNTSGNALYVLDSTAFTPAATESRNLRAASGWGGSSYTGARMAAPFAVLDVAVSATQKVLGVSPNQSFPALRMFWSANNLPAGGETEDQLAQGQIGTSFYLFDGSNGHRLFLLGAANTDTDEYDSHVIAHEWGHYFQEALSRNDGGGGPHGPGDKLDMRVAFSEGWGNAWSGIALGDPRYTDSLDVGQARGLTFDVSQAPGSNRGWFSEASVQYLLWQYAQTQAAGFGAMFEVMTGPLRTSSALVAIHQLSALLKTARPAAAGSIDAFLNGQLITVNDGLGSGETNDGGVAPSVLPLYTTYSSGDQTVCLNDNAGRPNKLGNFAYRRFTLSGSRTLSLTAVAGVAGSDPDILLIRADGTSQTFENTGSSESGTTTLPAGTHTAVLYDFNLLQSAGTVGQRCFNFRVQ